MDNEKTVLESSTTEEDIQLLKTEMYNNEKVDEVIKVNSDISWMGGDMND